MTDTKQAEPQGHWLVTFPVDDPKGKVYGCACGYTNIHQDAIEGHIHWEVEKMKVVVDKVMSQPKIDGNTSDGYHTFNELYHYRMLYNAGFFNELHFRTGKRENYSYKPVKSWRHSNGEKCFGGGWFVVVAQLPQGQVTNHYEAKWWDLFKIPEVDKAPEWDGADPKEVAERLERFLQP